MKYYPLERNHPKELFAGVQAFEKEIGAKIIHNTCRYSPDTDVAFDFNTNRYTNGRAEVRILSHTQPLAREISLHSMISAVPRHPILRLQVAGAWHNADEFSLSVTIYTQADEEIIVNTGPAGIGIYSAFANHNSIPLDDIQSPYVKSLLQDLQKAENTRPGKGRQTVWEIICDEMKGVRQVNESE